MAFSLYLCLYAHTNLLESYFGFMIALLVSEIKC
jgi:hypothetical protein